MATEFGRGRRGRGWWAVATAVALAVALAPIGVGSADAAVLCQRKSKVKIRSETCKKKETLVQDLGMLATDVAGQAAETAGLRGPFRLDCPGAPELVQAVSDDSFYYDRIDCIGGCRTHDGSQAACEGAWALSEDGATSCFFFNGLCLPCADCGTRAGVCQNRCRVIGTASCPGDPTRTTFAGGPGSDACLGFGTQTACEAAFHFGLGKVPATCYWDGSNCRGCGPYNENNGNCTNTCQTPTCSDPARTTRAYCWGIGNDSTACNAAWHLSAKSGAEPASCWFDTDASQCKGCGIKHELRGDCVNACR